MTNSDFIRDALGLIGVLRISQSPDANQGAQALRVMNNMFFEWEAMGVNLGWIKQTSTTEDFPLEDALVLACQSNLAIRLAPFYERQPSAVAIGIAQAGYSRLVRDAAIAARESIDISDLSKGDASYLWPKTTLSIN